MKRSEFLLRRAAYWSQREGKLGPCWLEEQARRDAEAAEAAGVVWDPETEPLPERMFLGGEGALFAGSAIRAKKRVGYVYDDGDFIAIGKEAVRRYNLFPRIVAVLSRLGPGTFYGELIAEALRIAEEEG